MNKEKNQKPDGSWSALGLAWELGYTIAVPLVLFALAGRFLDKKLGTSPFLLLAGILLSIGVTSWLVYKKTKEIIEKE
ncbi:MAG: AtpZ/AtpI family protein [Candidatus Moranbacteria bacterium]|nr:AtpZ/AtpI family protein [Candidatus Moranbacteria bacterium]